MSNRYQESWEAAYRNRQCAWDTRVPSPELLSRLEQLKLAPSRVLDIGCGTGANALFMARQGHSVFAIDFVEAAIEEARRLADEQGQSVAFRTADFLTLTDYSEEFSFVFDSGVYHSIRKYALKRYMEIVWRVMKPKALFVTLVGNPEHAERWGPARVTAAELLAEHHPYFELLELKQFRFDSTIDDDRPLGWSVLLRKRTTPQSLTALMPGVATAADFTVSPVDDIPLVTRVERIIARIALSDYFPWKIVLSVRPNPGGDFGDLLIEYSAPERTTGKTKTIRYQRTAAFRAALSDEELLHIIVTNLVVIAVHELLENFTFDGERSFDPHTVARLMDSRYAELAMLTPTGALDERFPGVRKMS
jgi:SAM-dependent methyltransferase